MRQFLLAGSGAYASSLPLTAGQFAITTLVDGKETISADGAAVKNTFYFNLKKAEGDTVVIAGSKRHFSFAKSAYVAGSAYSGEVTIPAATASGEFTLILVKKGAKFNERNRWSASVPVKTGDSANDIAAKLGKYFEANASALNVKVTVSGAKITIAGNDKHDDFVLMGADDLSGVAVTNTAAVAPLNDAAQIKDLAAKAAADAGFVYTYEDLDINPAYPLNPLAQADKADTGFTVFTCRYAVPREVKTRDEVVHQIVQIAFPTGSAAIATVEAIFEELAGDTADAE